MTWSLLVGGNVDDRDAEDALIDHALTLVDSLDGVTYASFVSTNRGTVNLLSPDTSPSPPNEEMPNVAESNPAGVPDQPANLHVAGEGGVDVNS